MNYDLLAMLENFDLYDGRGKNSIHFAIEEQGKPGDQPTIGYGYDIEQNGFNATHLNSKAETTIITTEQMTRFEYLYQKRESLNSTEKIEYSNIISNTTITKDQAMTLLNNMAIGWENSLNTILNNNNVTCLNDQHKIVLISIFYNTCGSSVSAITASHPKVVQKFIPMLNTTVESQICIAKLGIWNEILYGTNKDNIKGLQNRRFSEANTFMGGKETKYDDSTAEAQIPVSNLLEAQIVMAFMNANMSPMFYKLRAIDGYKNSPYQYIQKHAQSAVEFLLEAKKYVPMRTRDNIPAGKFAPEYKLENLFGGWNLRTDLWLSRAADGGFSGGIYYDLPIFANSNEMFIMSQQMLGTGVRKITPLSGDDYIDTSSLSRGESFKALLGGGYNTYIGGDGDDYVDGGVNSDTMFIVNHVELGGGNNFYIGGQGVDIVSTITDNPQIGDSSKVYLGGGSDIFYGGDGDDFVDGGSGNLPDAADLDPAIGEIDPMKLRDMSGRVFPEGTVRDSNKIYLGGGSNTYISGMGNDIIYGGIRSPAETDEDGKPTADHNRAGNTNRIMLAMGNDIYHGCRANDIVDVSGSISADLKKIYLYEGNNQFIGGVGKSIVYMGNGNNKIMHGRNNDEFHLGSGRNEIQLDQYAKLFLAGGGTNIIEAKQGLKIYGSFRTADITLRNTFPNPGFYQKVDNDLEVHYNSEIVILGEYYNPDGTVGNGGLPRINGYIISPNI